MLLPRPRRLLRTALSGLLLPVEVISDQTRASYRDGVLEIHLPKSERAKAGSPRKVTIE